MMIEKRKKERRKVTRRFETKKMAPVRGSEQRREEP